MALLFNQTRVFIFRVRKADGVILQSLTLSGKEKKNTGKVKIVQENFVKFSLYFLGMQQQPCQSAAAVTTGNEEAWEEWEGVLPHRETADEQNLQLGLRVATSCGVFSFFQISLSLQRWR